MSILLNCFSLLKFLALKSYRRREIDPEKIVVKVKEMIVLRRAPPTRPQQKKCHMHLSLKSNCQINVQAKRQSSPNVPCLDQKELQRLIFTCQLIIF